MTAPTLMDIRTEWTMVEDSTEGTWVVAIFDFCTFLGAKRCKSWL
jgi:hypothetical protein